MDIGHRLKAVPQGSPLPAQTGKTLSVTNGFISQIEKNQVSPLGRVAAQGAGRHPHVARQLLRRRDGDGFRGVIFVRTTCRISAPTPSAIDWWATAAPTAPSA